MKPDIRILFALSVVALALVWSVKTPAAPKVPVKASAAATAPVATAQPTPDPATSEPAPSPEPHPEIREAIVALRRAKDHMMHAAHDFGGHRVEAIKATDEAIRQLQDCLKFDKD